MQSTKETKKERYLRREIRNTYKNRAQHPEVRPASVKDITNWDVCPASILKEKGY